jgi:hypothetical protein
MTHLSDEAVEWLARHGSRPERLGAAIQLGWIQHLEECEECKETVEEARQTGSFLARFINTGACHSSKSTNRSE